MHSDYVSFAHYKYSYTLTYLYDTALTPVVGRCDYEMIEGCTSQMATSDTRVTRRDKIWNEIRQTTGMEAFKVILRETGQVLKGECNLDIVWQSDCLFYISDNKFRHRILHITHKIV